MKTVCPCKNLYLSIYIIFIHNCLNLDTIQKSITCMDQQSLWHPYSRILLNKDSKLLIHAETWIHFLCIMQNKRSQTWKVTHILYDSIYMPLWKRHRYSSENRSVLHGRLITKRHAWWNFWGVMTLFYILIMVVTWLCICQNS